MTCLLQKVGQERVCGNAVLFDKWLRLLKPVYVGQNVWGKNPALFPVQLSNTAMNHRISGNRPSTVHIRKMFYFCYRNVSSGVVMYISRRGSFSVAVVMFCLTLASCVLGDSGQLGISEGCRVKPMQHHRLNRLKRCSYIGFHLNKKGHIFIVHLCAWISTSSERRISLKPN